MSNAQDIEDGFTRDVYVSRDLRLADPKFLEIFPKLKEAFGIGTGFDLSISCTYRSPKAQNDLYNIGRTVPPVGRQYWRTCCDGFQYLSKHNIFPSKAIDCFITYSGKPVWENEIFDRIGPIAKEFGLYWGGYGLGDDKDFIDRPHLELVV